MTKPKSKAKGDGKAFTPPPPLPSMPSFGVLDEMRPMIQSVIGTGGEWKGLLGAIGVGLFLAAVMLPDDRRH